MQTMPVRSSGDAVAERYGRPAVRGRRQRRRPGRLWCGRRPGRAPWWRGRNCLRPGWLENFAKATYAPLGCFFLPDPPVEEMPIPDLRTIDDGGVSKPSGNLLDTIYTCQRRQDWYREYALSIGDEPLPFIGSAEIDGPVVDTAAQMRRVLNLDTDGWRRHPRWMWSY